jgi:hypothetical protein
MGSECNSNWQGGPFGPSDAAHSYAALIAKRFGAAFHISAVSAKGLVHNHSDSNQISDTTLRDYFRRTVACSPSPRWNLSSWIPHLVIINAGTNDFAECFQRTQGGESWRKPADERMFIGAYASFLDTIRACYPGAKIILIGPYDRCGCKDSTAKVVRKVYDAQLTAGKRDCAWFSYPATVSSDYVCCHPSAAFHAKIADSLEKIVATTMNWRLSGVKQPRQAGRRPLQTGFRTPRFPLTPGFTFDVHGQRRCGIENNGIFYVSPADGARCSGQLIERRITMR